LKKEKEIYQKMLKNKNLIIFIPKTMFLLIYFFFIVSFSASSVSLLYFIYSKENRLFKEEQEPDETTVPEEVKVEEKYEDKYLLKVRKLLNENWEEIDMTKYSHLKNNFVLEKTPVGNVSMYFDIDTETFTYYSDNTIPYRFLEVLARKYVLTYNCVDLYVDMDKELELIEKRKVKREEKQKRKEEEEKENINNTKSTSEKKNVFAQFKTYNKDGGSGRVNSVAPPKNSISSTNSNTAYNPLLLKERANRYVSKGRFSNFPILKQVNRKKIDKDYALSFAEFKLKFILNQKL